jgi:hypothetical protein
MSIDNEILLDAEDDAREVAFIRQQLPQELKERLSDDDLYYILDVIIDYYTTSGVFEQEPDAEGCIDIDLDAVADFVVKKARKEKVGEFDHDDILLVVQAEMDYSEQQDEA